MSARSITDDLFDRLEYRYQPTEWALFRQVRDAAGFAGVRTADAIAMNLWPSRGLTLHGFEVKASRGDWLRELREPAKAEAVAKFCDFWWIVVPDAAIVGDDLPEGWGLLVPNRGKGLKVVSDAPKTEAADLTRSFLGALLRRAHGAAAFSTDAKLREEYRRGIAQGEENAQRRIDQARQSQEEWRGRWQQHETRWNELTARLGIEPSGWNPDQQILDAIRFALGANVDARMKHMQRLARDLRREIESFENNLGLYECLCQGGGGLDYCPRHGKVCKACGAKLEEGEVHAADCARCPLCDQNVEDGAEHEDGCKAVCAECGEDVGFLHNPHERGCSFHPLSASA